MENEKALKVLPLAVSVVVFSILFIGSLFLPSGLGPTPQNWFSDYALALSQGRLYLGEGNQWRDCKWDQSFFEGKCYLYFGIVPALFHWILPFVSNRIFSILGASLFSFFFAKVILKLSKTKEDEGLDWFLSFLLILSSIGAVSFLSLALCSRVYEETICIAHALGMAGIYFGLPYLGLNDEKEGTASLTLSSVCFGLAGLSRFTWFAVFAIFGVFVFFRNRKQLRGLSFFASLLPLFLAFFFSILFQAWLNWVRFKNPFEIGMSFQSFILRTKEVGKGMGFNSPLEALKICTSYYFLRFFPEGGIVVKKTAGFLQNVFLKDFVILFESPHTLTFTLPAAFFSFLHFKCWLLFLKTIWRPLVLVSPLAVAILSIPCVIYRYQFEGSAFLLLGSIPFLISRSSHFSNRTFLLLVLSCFVGLGFSTYCSVEVINRFWKVL